MLRLSLFMIHFRFFRHKYIYLSTLLWLTEVITLAVRRALRRVRALRKRLRRRSNSASVEEVEKKESTADGLCSEKEVSAASELAYLESMLAHWPVVVQQELERAQRIHGFHKLAASRAPELTTKTTMAASPTDSTPAASPVTSDKLPLGISVPLKADEATTLPRAKTEMNLESTKFVAHSFSDNDFACVACGVRTTSVDSINLVSV
jgi:hypothetical protein